MYYTVNIVIPLKVEADTQQDAEKIGRRFIDDLGLEDEYQSSGHIESITEREPYSWEL